MITRGKRILGLAMNEISQNNDKSKRTQHWVENLPANQPQIGINKFYGSSRPQKIVVMFKLKFMLFN